MVRLMKFEMSYVLYDIIEQTVEEHDTLTMMMMIIESACSIIIGVE